MTPTLEVDPDEVPADAVLVDVRSDDELAGGLIPGSVHVPLGSLPDGANAHLGRPIVAYCATGVRSLVAVRLLLDAGHASPASLRGGIDAWRHVGRPIEFPSAPDRYARYDRQMILPSVGRSGQERLAAATVAIVGAGGLGSPVATHLAAAGVGTLRLVDPDVVDLTNLHRQPIHDESGIGVAKVETARRRLRALNSTVTVEAHRVSLDADNATRLLGGVDVVVDATDRIPARYNLNDAAIALGVPLVHASVLRFEGRLTVFHPPAGPCYRCLHPVAPEPGSVPTCEVAGVLGVVPGVVGTMQATEVLKLLLGIGEPLVGTMVVYEALTQEIFRFRVPRNPSCGACGRLS